MNKGALVFAYNNSDIDYVSLAAWNTDNIHRHLDLPVALVTDRPPQSSIFDKVIIHENLSEPYQRWFDDFEKCVVWNNARRCLAWDLSPWDQTLLLDADYVVASNVLQPLINHVHGFVCHRSAIDAARCTAPVILPTFGRHQMPQWWATVAVFDRSQFSRSVFSVWQMIEDNWPHYCSLYGINERMFRNDYALSIALTTMSGHVIPSKAIPWNLVSVMPSDSIAQINQDRYRVNFQDANKRAKCIELRNTDFHAMGKRSLGDIVANSN